MMRDILRVVRYFSVFSYAPTPDDIYTFLSKKVSKRELEANLQNLTKKGVLKRVSLEIQGKKRAKYTLGEYGIKEAQMSNLKAQNYEMRYKTSQRKIAGVRFFIKMLSVFPQIKLVGFSGSCAMGNAKEDDDVDFFIISARGRMWTARFVANAIAFLLGIKRKRGIRKAKDKVCLNLIFDEEALEIPKFKHNEYVGHEVLQMKPIFNKNHIYEQFLQANHWVFHLFPNARNTTKNSILNFVEDRRVTRLEGLPTARSVASTGGRESRGRTRLSTLGDILELFLKKLQLSMIKLHQTSEIVTEGQLWFFPEDFEKKIKGMGI